MWFGFDVCVKHSAIDAVEQGFRTFVIVDGCRGVSHEGITKTNKEFVKSGIILLESNKIEDALRDKEKNGIQGY
ncbi:hypothetical protein OS493_027039 [Desmophyllum pertusum]|uniref:nicotinamidase n=1 Tax=Desmophyllum pertusum TaxID=174260 RepID=A0A9W9Y9N3_9CNID|nr:hypothetical protein OS493_027039 [Desmophyllum pertusum]